MSDSKCPKCGDPETGNSHTKETGVTMPFVSVFSCESWQDGTEFNQSKTCELTAENTRLKLIEEAARRFTAEIAVLDDSYCLSKLVAALNPQDKTQ